MNVEIGAEAALFPEKEYISGIFVAVYLAVKRRCGMTGVWPSDTQTTGKQIRADCMVG
jgi:hypothetical protein